MKPKTLLCLVFCLSISSVFAQDILDHVEWMDDFRGNWNWQSNCLVDADDENQIVFGVTYRGFESNYIEWKGDTIAAEDNVAGREVIFLSKVDAFGELVWSNLLVGSKSLFLRELKTDHDQNVILLLHCEDSLLAFGQTFNRGYHLIKLNPGGQFIWSMSLNHLKYADANLYTEGHLLSIACDNDILIGGSIGQVVYDSVAFDIVFGDTIFGYLYKYDTLHLGGQSFAADTHNIFIARLDAFGQLRWLKSFEHTGELGLYSIDASNPYAVALLGAFHDEDWSVYNKTLVADTSGIGNSHNMFIMTLNSEGQVQWINQYFSKAVPHHIVFDYYGSLIAVGSFHSETHMGTDTIFEEDGSGDLLLFKTDRFGNYLWGTHTGDQTTNFGGTILTNEQGDIYLTGGLSNNLGPILNKYDGWGNLLWSLDPEGSSNRSNLTMTMDNSGYLIMVGYFSGELSLGNQTVEQVGPYCNFMVKFNAELDPHLNTICETLSSTELANNILDLTTIYPNPASKTILFDFPDTKNNVILGIYNIVGNEMLSDFRNDGFPYEINVSNWPEGFYAARLTSGATQIVKLFVVQRQ